MFWATEPPERSASACHVVRVCFQPTLCVDTAVVTPVRNLSNRCLFY